MLKVYHASLDNNQLTILDKLSIVVLFSWIFFFFIKCMQPMAMALSRRCVCAELHLTWPKSLLYIFPLVNHTGSLRIQALWFKPPQPYFRFPSSLCLPFLIAIFLSQFEYFADTLVLQFFRSWWRRVSVWCLCFWAELFPWALSALLCSACNLVVSAPAFDSQCIFHSIYSNHPQIIAANSSWSSRVLSSTE